MEFSLHLNDYIYFLYFSYLVMESLEQPCINKNIFSPTVLGFFSFGELNNYSTSAVCMSSIVANTRRFKHNPAVSVVGRPSWERVYVSASLRRWHSIHTPHLLTTIPCSILRYQHCHNGNPFLRHWLTCELVICICVEIFKPSVSITQAYNRDFLLVQVQIIKWHYKLNAESKAD